MTTPERQPALSPEELEVAIEARRELTTEHEAELIETFLDQVGTAIDARVDERLEKRDVDADDDGRGGEAVGLALGSIALGIPITAVAESAGVPGIVVAWVGIVLVNVAYWRRPGGQA